jgi:hypothetical protein
VLPLVGIADVTQSKFDHQTLVRDALAFMPRDPNELFAEDGDFAQLGLSRKGLKCVGEAFCVVLQACGLVQAALDMFKAHLADVDRDLLLREAAFIHDQLLTHVPRKLPLLRGCGVDDFALVTTDHDALNGQRAYNYAHQLCREQGKADFKTANRWGRVFTDDWATELAWATDRCPVAKARKDHIQSVFDVWDPVAGFGCSEKQSDLKGSDLKGLRLNVLQWLNRGNVNAVIVALVARQPWAYVGLGTEAVNELHSQTEVCALINPTHHTRQEKPLTANRLLEIAKTFVLDKGHNGSRLFKAVTALWALRAPVQLNGSSSAPPPRALGSVDDGSSRRSSERLAKGLTPVQKPTGPIEVASGLEANKAASEKTKNPVSDSSGSGDKGKGADPSNARGKALGPTTREDPKEVAVDGAAERAAATGGRKVNVSGGTAGPLPAAVVPSDLEVNTASKEKNSALPPSALKSVDDGSNRRSSERLANNRLVGEGLMPVQKPTGASGLEAKAASEKTKKPVSDSSGSGAKGKGPDPSNARGKALGPTAREDPKQAAVDGATERAAATGRRKANASGGTAGPLPAAVVASGLEAKTASKKKTKLASSSSGSGDEDKGADRGSSGGKASDAAARKDPTEVEGGLTAAAIAKTVLADACTALGRFRSSREDPTWLGWLERSMTAFVENVPVASRPQESLELLRNLLGLSTTPAAHVWEAVGCLHSDSGDGGLRSQPKYYDHYVTFLVNKRPYPAGSTRFLFSESLPDGLAGLGTSATLNIRQLDARVHSALNGTPGESIFKRLNQHPLRVVFGFSTVDDLKSWIAEQRPRSDKSLGSWWLDTAGSVWVGQAFLTQALTLRVQSTLPPSSQKLSAKDLCIFQQADHPGNPSLCPCYAMLALLWAAAGLTFTGKCITLQLANDLQDWLGKTLECSLYEQPLAANNLYGWLFALLHYLWTFGQAQTVHLQRCHELLHPFKAPVPSKHGAGRTCSEVPCELYSLLATAAFTLIARTLLPRPDRFTARSINATFTPPHPPPPPHTHTHTPHTPTHTHTHTHAHTHTRTHNQLDIRSRLLTNTSTWAPLMTAAVAAACPSCPVAPSFLLRVTAVGPRC